MCPGSRYAHHCLLSHRALSGKDLHLHHSCLLGDVCHDRSGLSPCVRVLQCTQQHALLGGEMSHMADWRSARAAGAALTAMTSAGADLRSVGGRGTSRGHLQGGLEAQGGSTL